MCNVRVVTVTLFVVSIVVILNYVTLLKVSITKTSYARDIIAIIPDSALFQYLSRLKINAF
jgi:hypothetical protein